jgi:hypothetical protein
MAGLVGQLFPEASGIRLLVDLYVGFVRKDVPVVLVSNTPRSLSVAPVQGSLVVEHGMVCWAPLLIN